MNNMIDKLIYILDAYGINNQIKKYNEETFELEEAMMDYNHFIENGIIYDKIRKQLKGHIEEEFADVLVLLNQIKIYYCLDNKNIKDIMKRKIDRQIKRIDKE